MKKFLIPSLLLAGFFGGGAKALPAAGPAITGDDDKGGVRGLFEVFRQEHRFTLAAHSSHRSHSSHASHSSHSSHRSSSGGGYSYSPPAAAPAPRLYTPPSSASPSPAAPAPRTLPGNSAAFIAIARQVQTALQAYGYYTGPIDGIIGAGSRDALRRFQAAYHLPVTGTITPEVLDAFGIVAN